MSLPETQRGARGLFVQAVPKKDLDILAGPAAGGRPAGGQPGLARGHAAGVGVDRPGARPAAVVVAGAGAGEPWCCCCVRSASWRAGGAARLGFCHGLAGLHLWLAVHLHAHLWRAGRPRWPFWRCWRWPACWRSTTRLLVAVFRRLAPVHPVVGGAGFCRLVAACRDGPGHVVDRLWLGRHWLCAPGRPLAWLIPWVGLYGVSFVAAGLVACLALGCAGCAAGRWREAFSAVLVLLALLLLPPWLPPPQGGSARHAGRDPAAGQYSAERKI